MQSSKFKIEINELPKWSYLFYYPENDNYGVCVLRAGSENSRQALIELKEILELAADIKAVLNSGMGHNLTKEEVSKLDFILK